MTTPPDKKKPPSRLGLLVPWALFALLIAGWTGYWFVLKDQATRQIESAFAQARASGAEAAYGALSVDGYPLRVSLRIADLRYAPADKAWRASLPKASVHVNPINILHLIATADAPLRLTGSDGATHVFTAPKAMVSVRVNTDGALQRASVDLEGLAIARDGEAKPGSGVGKLVAHLRPDARAEGRLQLALDLTEAALARPVERFEALGQTIASLSVRGVIAQAPGQELAAAIAGAPLEIEGLGLVWGPLDATGEGRLGLDAQRRPDGSLTLNVKEPGRALAALGLAPEVASTIAAAAPADQPLTVPLEARAGALLIGPVKLRDLKPIY